MVHTQAPPLHSGVTQFTVSAGKRSEHPRGMPLVTRMQGLEANMRVDKQAWDPKASLSATFYTQTASPHLGQNWNALAPEETKSQSRIRLVSLVRRHPTCLTLPAFSGVCGAAESMVSAA
jgi:hypothetical protein